MTTSLPDLGIPGSINTVGVSIIDTTSSIRGVAASRFISPSIPGHEYLGAPAFSFLVYHPLLERTIIFDLGIRKDWWNSSPPLQAHMKSGSYVVKVEKGVREILEEDGVDCNKIEAVVWSHWHWDHTGDPSTFEKSTALIVGPGFKNNIMPGYPANPNSSILESDYQGRELRELDFEVSTLKIGKFPAIDYFGDGSFYFLNAPGHAIGHICGLARVTSKPDSFIFMGGDSCHHGGEMRPSPWLPFPESIFPHPFTPLRQSICPGAMFEKLLPGGNKCGPFYEPARHEQGQVHHDVDEAIETIKKLQEADMQDNILVVVAHDESLLDIVDFFPQTANQFMEKGWVKEARWRFLKDFAKAVGWDGEVDGRRDWAP